MAFEPGQSGNPSGRPPGIEDKRVRLRRLLDDKADALVQKAVDLAIEGDRQMLRLCIERLVPPYKARGESVPLDGLSAPGLADAGRAVLAAIEAGTLDPDTGGTLLQALGAQARVVDVADLSKRLEALEQRLENK